jgi:hypothetical protein
MKRPACTHCLGDGNQLHNVDYHYSTMAGTGYSTQDLLWVNKTIHSSALSNNKDDAVSMRSVNKHVQRKRTRSWLTEHQSQVLGGDGPPVIRWKAGSVTRQKKPSKDIVTPEDGKPVKSALVLLSEIPPSCGSPVDPFNSSSVAITGEVFGFLRHFTETFLAGAIQTQVQNVLSPGKPRSSQSLAATKIVQDCMADPKHMYSVLALTSHQIKYLIGHKLPRMDRPEYYMAKALEGLRMTFDPDKVDAISQQVILDFAWMATAEAYRDNFTGALAYQHINKFAIQKFGGIERAEPFVREICRIGDIFISSLSLTPPVLGIVGDPGPISEEFRREIDRRILPHRRMGAAFLEYESLWDLVMTDIMQDLLDVVQAAQFLWAFPESHVSSKDRDWVLQRCHTLTHKLLMISRRTPPLTFEDAVQECCRLCFILWLFYVLSGTSGVPSEPGSLMKVRNIMPEHTRRLQKSVEHADTLDTHATGWGPYNELRVWISAFGTLACKTESCWFALQILADCSMRSIYTYDYLAAITSKYLSLDRLEQLSNRKLARILITGLIEE